MSALNSNKKSFKIDKIKNIGTELKRISVLENGDRDGLATENRTQNLGRTKPMQVSAAELKQQMGAGDQWRSRSGGESR